MTNTLFACDHVSRTFGSGNRAVVAVHDVTCAAEQGARVAVVGPSGSGKSTLIHLLAGLDEPTRGSVRWPGLGGHPRHDATLVGVVFQGQSLIPALTAQENVALPLVLRDIPHREAQRLALHAMHRLGVDVFANQLPDELSGGQAQRVAVARVLTMKPRLILADEPTGRLDQVAARLVIDVLLAAADELGAGLVIATHDPHVTERLATRWRMRDGVLECGTPAVGAPR
jgi:putative ABC transport system ATP-binding protein